MRTLNISLSEQDYEKYGINADTISFNSFIEKIKNVLAKEALEKCQLIAKKSGLDKMTIDEINAEIEEVRRAKDRN